MDRLLRGSLLIVALSLGACESPSPPTDAAASTQDPAPAAAAPSVDPELAQLQALTPPDACALLSEQVLGTVYPELEFKLHERVPPRLSGYAWDSRCTYWAGVGSTALAPDAPTHTVALYLRTPANAAKAAGNLAARHAAATSATGYAPAPALGADAHTISQTGTVSLYFVRGGSEAQIDVASPTEASADRLAKALALAQAL